MLQDFPARMLMPQLFVCEKSTAFLPVIVILVMLSTVVPVLISVVILVLVRPTITKPKSKPAGMSFTTVPAPVRVTVWGLPSALSMIDNVPVRVPRCVGLNARSIVQLAPVARVAVQLLDWMLKSPLATILEIVRVLVP